MLQENAKLVESKDIRWKDFGGKYRNKVKRDGSQLVKMLDDDINVLSQNSSSSSANSERVEDDKAVVDITDGAVMRRVLSKIQNLIKWSQEERRKSSLY
jgi:hypothetical protein